MSRLWSLREFHFCKPYIQATIRILPKCVVWLMENDAMPVMIAGVLLFARSIQSFALMSCCVNSGQCVNFNGKKV